MNARRRLIATTTSASTSAQKPISSGAVGSTGCHSSMPMAWIRAVDSQMKAKMPDPSGVAIAASADSGNTTASARTRRRSSGAPRTRQRRTAAAVAPPTTSPPSDTPACAFAQTRNSSGIGQ